MSNKFSVYYSWYNLVLRCDVCHARDWGHGDVIAWDAQEDVNLAALVSRAQGHWASIHEQEVVG